MLIWYVVFFLHIINGRPARSEAMPVLFLLSGPKWVFHPAGATHCPDKREI